MEQGYLMPMRRNVSVETQNIASPVGKVCDMICMEDLHRLFACGRRKILRLYRETIPRCPKPLLTNYAHRLTDASFRSA